MLSNLRAPEVGLPLLGGPVPGVRPNRAVRDSTLVAWIVAFTHLREVVRAAVTAVVSVVGSARAAVGGCGWPWGRSGLWDSSSQGAYRGSFVRASIAPWPRPPRCVRLPQQWPDRAQPGTADRLRPAARAHPAQQSAALIPACSAARGGSCDDCSSPQV